MAKRKTTRRTGAAPARSRTSSTSRPDRPEPKPGEGTSKARARKPAGARTPSADDRFTAPSARGGGAGGDGEGVGFADFLTEISGAMVSAQQRLDGQTEAYLAGSSNPQPLPAMFRIPKLTAEMKFALSKDSSQGFRLIFRSETSESLKQEQSLKFDIVAVPPPPESGITPGPYMPLMPRIELLIGGVRRQWLLRVAADGTAQQTLGIPPPQEAGRNPDKPFDLLVWQVVRADEENEAQRTAERHYVAGSTATGAVQLWLVSVPDTAARPVQLHASPPFPAPFNDWLMAFLQGGGRRQVEMLTPPAPQR